MVKKTKKQNGGGNSSMMKGAIGNVSSSMKRRSMKVVGNLSGQQKPLFGTTLKRNQRKFIPNPSKMPFVFNESFLKKGTTEQQLEPEKITQIATVDPKITAELQKLPTTAPALSTTAEPANITQTATTELIAETPTIVKPAENLSTATLKISPNLSRASNLASKIAETILPTATSKTVPKDAGYFEVGPDIIKSQNLRDEYIDVNPSTNSGYLKIFPTYYENNKQKQEVYKILTDTARRANNFSARITRINPEILSKFQNDNTRLSYFRRNFAPDMATTINDFFSKELQNITNKTEKQKKIQKILNDFKSKALNNNNTRQTIYNNTQKFLGKSRKENTKKGKTNRSKSIANEIQKIRNAGYSKLNPTTRSTSTSPSPSRRVDYNILAQRKP